MKRAACVLVGLMLVTGRLDAATHRVAVVVGHNTGSEQQRPLRYAESDAAKFARVLTETGGVARDDLFLLQAPATAEIERAVAAATGRMDQAHRAPDRRSLLLFFFSGHSDGEAMVLGRERLTFVSLKAMLEATGADVRILVLDACRSGAAVLTKGGMPAPAFTIRLTDDLNTSGEVILSSSAADELALESRRMRGSYFTHHLVSGLRGAADQSGDGRVTLNELYRYAYERTVTSSAMTLEGPHHPTYRLELSGRGELVLAFLETADSIIALPDDVDRGLIVDTTRDQVMAEVGVGSARKVALEPGRYEVQLWRGGTMRHGRFTLARGQHRSLTWAELAQEALPVPAGKKEAIAEGGEPESSRPAELRFTVGASGGVAKELGAALALRLGFALRGFHGWTGAIAGQYGNGPRGAFSESMVQVRGGYTWSADIGSVSVQAALEAGPGLMWQQANNEQVGATFLVVFGPSLCVAWWQREGLALTLQAEWVAGLLELDGAVKAHAFPALRAGFTARL